MSAVAELFVKPEIPVSVRIPEELALMAAERGVCVSKAIRLGVYALLEAAEAGETDLSEVRNAPRHAHVRRTTIRLPIGVHDRVEGLLAPLSVSGALAAVASLYLENPDTLDHV